MDDTPNLKLPIIAAAQAQKHVTHNEALRALDAIVQLAVETADLASPPTAPAEGARYIVAAGAVGAWSGMDGRIAAFQDGGWAFHVPCEGWVAWVTDTALLHVFDGGAWVAQAKGLTSVNPIALVGVATVADATNKLAVKSNAVLFSHDDVTPGNGSIQAKLNKATATTTASVLFQDGWSGRAEMGLTGDDDFHVKVSADGGTWHEGVTIERATGRVSFPNSRYREVLTAARSYYVRPDGNDENNGRTDSAAGAFLTLSGAYAKIAAAIDGAGYDVSLIVAPGSYANIVATTPPIGIRELKIVGRTGVAADVVISGANYIDGHMTLSFAAVTLSAVQTSAISVKIGTVRLRGNVVFDAANIHIWLRDRAICYVDNDYTIAAGAAQHIRMDVQSFYYAANRTVTLTGTPAFTQFIYAQQAAVASFYLCAFSGAATGVRYNISKNALVDTYGAGASFLPGSTAGTVATGGAYT